MPSCGDETLPFGSAYYLNTNLLKKSSYPFENIYLGVRYTNQDVKNFLNENGCFKKYKITYCDDIENSLAELLSMNHVVARVKGSCEFGARSLGNRSILANPSTMESFYKVNDQIKMRDFWMPFAPSILFEEQHQYIINKNNTEAPYMILGFDSTEVGKVNLKAAMHQADKSVRPQIVKRQTNPSYHYLLMKFYEKTKIGALMNTSLNIHGYPLAGTLEQSLFTFSNSELKFIAMENYLISKE